MIDLDNARAKDKLSGRELSVVFLEEMLADPMVQLVMQADGVTEAQLRHLYSGSRTTRENIDLVGQSPKDDTPQVFSQDSSEVQNAENEGMPCQQSTSPIPE
ncbi:hypothetical protein [uncultured Ruegeria sp.]|uniref:hypothetical protein n=1 Tax=uncultured Ruegeria sp. TaxID=259304 RepID=UPI002622DF3F|nr:hypothetical protein [uncultured Ruegeria sp.]